MCSVPRFALNVAIHTRQVRRRLDESLFGRSDTAGGTTGLSHNAVACRAMVRGAKTIFSPEALEYLAEHSRQDEVLARVERETAEMPRAMMQISPDQGALMELLTKLVGTRNALEV